MKPTYLYFFTLFLEAVGRAEQNYNIRNFSNGKFDTDYWFHVCDTRIANAQFHMLLQDCRRIHLSTTTNTKGSLLRKHVYYQSQTPNKQLCASLLPILNSKKWLYASLLTVANTKNYGYADVSQQSEANLIITHLTKLFIRLLNIAYYFCLVHSPP